MSVNTDIKYRNQLLYSVFVRDYGLNGTFQDVEEDLDRIRSLGTDIIWFMPIHPIGKIGRKGSIGSPYAISDYRAVNPDFGTIEDSIRLLTPAMIMIFISSWHIICWEKVLSANIWIA